MHARGVEQIIECEALKHMIVLQKSLALATFYLLMPKKAKEALQFVPVSRYNNILKTYQLVQNVFHGSMCFLTICELAANNMHN